LLITFQSMGQAPTYSGARFFPDGRTVAQSVLASSGTAVADIFQYGMRIRGTFDVTFGSDRVCGCFDARIP
jgi:hypothetical protein